MSRILHLALPLTLVVIGGCDLVAAFTSGAAKDGSTGAIDAGDADTQIRSDHGSLGSDADGPSLPPDTRPPDGAPCIPNAPALAANVADCSCVSGTNEDCDGLAGIIDPQPNTCNPLLLEATLTNAKKHGWTFYGSGWRFACGGLQQRETTIRNTIDDFAWAYAATPLPSTDVVIEARVTLGPISDPDEWMVGIVGRLGMPADSSGVPAMFISCSLRVDRDERFDTYFGPGIGVDNPDVKVEMRNLGWQGAWPRDDNPPLINGADGQTVRIVMWYQATPYTKRQLICRILDDALTKGREGRYEIFSSGADPSLPNVNDGYLPLQPGSIGLRTRNRQATFDYIRVYSAPGI